MYRWTRWVYLVPLAAATAASAHAQTAAPSTPHLIVVKLVPKGDRFAFDPSTIAAQPGDTVRFVQEGAVPHNVSFRKQPKGAKLGAAAVGPYLVTAGQTYDLVIDSRFANGTYAFACDPHEGVGMTGVLTVGSP